ncbi:hypothetical protein KSS87_004589 [Heliosperma pusillum]|nr:hypothetical protein KSS87_004589 [Heliosperma pusillum]
MAFGRYARVDRHNSSNNCLTISIVVFVTACLIGVWITMSSSIGPASLGITLDLFMGGMPKKVNGNNTYAPAPEDTSKGSLSQASPLDEGNPDISENVDVTPKKSHPAQKVVEDLVSENEEGNTRAKEINGGEDNKVSGDYQVNRGSDGMSLGTKNDPEKIERAGELETKVEETRDNQDKIPPTKEDIVAADSLGQSDKAGQEQSEDPKEGYLEDKPSETESSERLPFENPPPIEPLMTQVAKSEKEKALANSPLSMHLRNYRWKVCNTTSGPDYIPCLDNIKAIKRLHGISHYEHMERHCPDEPPICLVPLPKGYRTPIRWPKSKDMIWFANVPSTRLAEYKKDQNWVRVHGRYTTFPGGGTQFKNGALHYIDFIQKTLPDIAWGKRTRVILDVGCGVASFGGYLFERGVLTMSLAPKDVHEAQVQFALERGIPAILAVMGSRRLPFPSNVFDIVHCARCRVPWHAEGGRLLLELNRVLRPGGYFVWSATPVYRRGAEDSGIWKDMSMLTKSMCWELVKVGKDELNKVSAAIFRKPTSNDCYERRPKNDPPLCEESDDPNSAWYTLLTPCIHKVPLDPSVRGSQWPASWPSRLENSPYWLKGSETGVSPNDFYDDYNHWKHVRGSSYMNGIGVDWSVVRNVMDMKASHGGFAAALKDLPLWVMNVVPVNSSDTLPIIYERGLLGLYHDWCESFNTYPRSYDLLHANHLFSDLKQRCNFVAVMAEVDRVLRPGGKLIVRDDPVTISEVESVVKSLHWRIKFMQLRDNEALLCVEKTFWRPTEVETIVAAIVP